MPWSEFFRFFYIIGFANSIFFSVLVFSKKEKSSADKILGTWLIFLGIQFIIPFLYLADFDKYLQFAGYEITIFSLHPIFLYLYIKALTQVNFNKKTVLLSFSTMLLILISMLPFYFMPNERRIAMLQAHTVLHWTIIPGLIVILFLFGYFLISSFSILKKHKNHTLHLYSYRDNVDLLWLRRLFVSFTLIFFLSIPVSILLLYFDMTLALSDYIYYTLLVGFVFFLGYWGYQQGNIFKQNSETTNAKKIKHSHEPELEFEVQAKELSILMESKKPYLDASLSIHQLADITNTTPHLLSKIINKSFHKNFFEFINDYRILEFKQLLSHPKFKNLTILGIALECGFNSKSSFNRIFKEHTKQTPGEYKKSLTL